VAKASRVGEPDLKEEEIVDPAKMVHDLENQLNGSGQPNEKVGLEAVTGVGKGAPRANEPPPGTTTANKPAEGVPPPAAPAQVNEVKQQAQQGADSGQTPTATASGDQTAKKVDKKKESTSKKKKKKGLGRLNPF